MNGRRITLLTRLSEKRQKILRLKKNRSMLKMMEEKRQRID